MTFKAQCFMPAKDLMDETNLCVDFFDCSKKLYFTFEDKNIILFFT